ncbi:MAG: hypothetical protein ACJ8DC_08310 [Gemmatimonadales bacterium]
MPASIILLAGCGDSTEPTHAAPVSPWQVATQKAVQEAGLKGLVGVQLDGTGPSARVIRLIGDASQATALAKTNLRLAELGTPSRAATASRLAMAALAASDLFEIRPAGTGLAPTSYTYSAAWGCADESTGGVWQPTTVIIDGWTAEAAPQTGGHVHDAASKPVGTWNPVSGATSGDGVWTTNFTAPPFAGTANLRYRVTGATRCTGTAQVAVTYSIVVPGLVALGASAEYDLIGQTSTHPDNHYGVQSFVAKLQSLASTFRSKYQSKLAYNDMSLASGGWFDLSAGWGGAHAEHRVGRNADLRTNGLTGKQLKFVRIEWSALGGSVHDETDTGAPHYHLRY